MYPVCLVPEVGCVCLYLFFKSLETVAVTAEGGLPAICSTSELALNSNNM